MSGNPMNILGDASGMIPGLGANTSGLGGITSGLGGILGMIPGLGGITSGLGDLGGILGRFLVLVESKTSGLGEWWNPTTPNDSWSWWSWWNPKNDS